MAVFKCKMCGADLKVELNQTVVTCEYCGSSQTVAVSGDDNKTELYNRANKLRSSCDFDGGLVAYQLILSKFPNESEAYWGLVLCKYGIEYVDDPKTKNKIPTIHRASYDSILKDKDYKNALKYADPIAKDQYILEAEKISEIQKGIISISQNEDPFDIFICYKETDEDGERTQDSVIAEDIYDHLTDRGYNVFFARITLEEILGSEYEPYIFAALNSAKVMLVIGSKKEYFNAIWVKNEWSRYLSIMGKHSNRHLIPCYIDIDAYEMPEEFNSLQAQDLGKLGYLQDLTRGIDKLLGREKKTKSSNSNVNVDTLFTIIDMFMADSNFEKVKPLLADVFMQDPENGKAHLYNFLINYNVRNISELKTLKTPIEYDDLYENVLEYCDEDDQIAIEDIKEELDEKFLEAELRPMYEKAVALQDDLLFMEAHKLYHQILRKMNYKDAKSRDEKCVEEILLYAFKLEVIERYGKAREIFNILKGNDKAKKQEEGFVKRLSKKAEREIELGNFVEARIYYINAFDPFDRSEKSNEFYEKWYNYAISLENAEKYDLAIENFDKISYFKKSCDKEIEECKKKKEIKEKTDLYNLSLFDEKTPYSPSAMEKLNESIKNLETLKEFKDSDSLLQRYKAILVEYQKAKEDEERAIALRKKKKQRMTIIFSLSAAAIVALITTTFTFFIPLGREGQIRDLINKGNYDEASKLINKNGSFGDSKRLNFFNDACLSLKKNNYLTGIESAVESAGVIVNVTFDANGGNISKASETYVDSFTEIDVQAHMKGHEFTDWSVTSFNADAKNYVIDINLKAIWDVSVYNIKYLDIDNISTNNLPKTYIMGDKTKIPEISKKGYTFMGWGPSYDGYNKGEKTIEIPDDIDGNITLKAIWEANKYKVSLDVNEGDQLASSDIEIEFDSSYDLPVPVRDDYTFLGWYDGETIFNNSGTWNLTKDVQLKAKWEQGSQGLEYTLENGTYTISKYNGIDTDVFIPNTHNGKQVTSIGSLAFKDNAFIESITIPSSIKSVGENAFISCPKLKKVIIESSDTKLSQNIFSDDRVMLFCNFDESQVTNWDQNWRSAGTSVLWNSTGATEYTEDGFCWSLNNSNELYIVGFDGELTSITIPSKINDVPVHGIATGSFENMNLTEIIISEGVIDIAPYAFAMNNLDNIYLSDSVLTVGSHAFTSSNSNTVFVNYAGASIPVAWTENWITSNDTYICFNCASGMEDTENGIKYYKTNDNTITLVKCVVTERDFDLPSEINGITVTEILSDFIVIDSSMPTIEYIYIPRTIKTIASGAFLNSKVVSTTTINCGAASPKLVDYKAGWTGDAYADWDVAQFGQSGSFKWFNWSLRGDGTVKLRNYYGPSGNSVEIVTPNEIDGKPVTAIDEYCFSNVKCKKITVSEGVKYLYERAFSTVKNCDTIILPTTLEIMEDYALTECVQLTNLYIKAKKDKVNHSRLFIYNYNNDPITTVHWNRNGNMGTTNDGFSWAGLGNGNIVITGYSGSESSIVIPDTIDGINVTTIGEKCFASNKKLKSVIFSDNITEIENGAFYECESIEALELPSALESIGQYALSYTGIKELVVPDTVTFIGKNFFSSSRRVYLFFETKEALSTWDPSWKGNLNKRVYFNYANEKGRTDDGFGWYKTNDDEITIFNILARDIELIIPSTINNLPVTTIYDSAFDLVTKRDIFIPSSITEMNAESVGSDYLLYFESSELTDKIILNDSARAIVGYANVKGVTEDGFSYVIDGTGKAVIYDFNGKIKNRTLTIPSKIGEYQVYKVLDYSIKNANDAQKIVISDGIEFIGSHAFNFDSAIVSIPDSVTTIESDAFADGEAHSSSYYCAPSAKPAGWAVNFPENQAYFNFGGEYGVTEDGLKWLSFKDGTVEIIDYLGRENKVIIPDLINEKKVTKIGQKAFYDKGLRNVTVGNNVTTIGGSAFAENELSYIYIPGSVDNMDYHALYDIDYVLLEADKAKEGFEYGWAEFCDINYNAKDKFGTTQDSFEWIEYDNKIVLVGYTGTNKILELPETINGKPVFRIGSQFLVNNNNVKMIYITSKISRAEGPIYGKDGGIIYYQGNEKDLREWSWSYDRYSKVYISDVKYSVENDYVYVPSSDGVNNEIALYIGSSKDLIIPDKIAGKEVSRINSYAFNDAGLDSIFIPSNISYVGKYGFNRMDSALIYTELTDISNWYESWSDGTVGLIILNCSKNFGTTEDNFDWVLTNANKIILTGYSGTNPIVSVPSSVNGYEVTTIGPKVFEGHTEITNINISNTITRICQRAFAGCTSLSYLYVPNTVENIGRAAFEDCSIDLYCQDDRAPIGYKMIEGAVKCNIYSNASRTMGTTADGLKWYKSNYDEIFIIGYVGDATEITIPSTIDTYSVREIFPGVFDSSTNVTKVTLPSTVKYVYKNAFYNCETLETVIIQNARVTLYDSAFNGIDCNIYFTGYSTENWSVNWSENSNCEVYFDSTGEFGEDANGYQWLEKTSGIVITKYTGDLTDVTVPSQIENKNVIQIGPHAFENCTNLTNINLPTTLKYIGSHAFENCTNLTNVNLENGLVSIGSYAFAHCINLTSINLPANLDNIQSYAFYNCLSLKTIYINSATRYLDEYVFSYCTIDVYVCNKKDYINLYWNSYWSFGADKINVYANASQSYGNTSSDYKWYLTNDNTVAITGYTGTEEYVEIPSQIEGHDVVFIEDNAFGTIECKDKIKKVYIPSTVTSVGDCIFKGTSDITVFIGANSSVVSNWPTEWSEGTYNLTYYTDCANSTINKSAEGFNWYLSNSGETVIISYEGTEKDLVIPEHIDADRNISIYHKAFYDNELTKLTLPITVINVGDNIVSNNPDLVIYCAATSKPTSWSDLWNNDNTVVYDHSGLSGKTEDGIEWELKGDKTIRIVSYSGTDSVVNIPAQIDGHNVVEIANSAFKDNTKITRLILPSTLTRIGEYAFSGCSSLNRVTASDNLTRIEQHAFDGCISLKYFYLPNSLEYIGNSAFYGDNNIKIYKSSTLNTTDFDTNWHLKETDANSNSTYHTIEAYSGVYGITENGIEWVQINETEAMILVYNGNETTVVIPDKINGLTVTEIGDRAFFGKSSITSITLPNSLKIIRTRAFGNCIGLTEVIIPGSVRIIEESIFSGCSPQLVTKCNSSARPYEWADNWNDSYGPVLWSGEW